MHDDLLNILSDSNKDINNQKLMDYISGKLAEEEKHEVERWLVDNPFFDEAVEGIRQVKNEKKMQAMVEQLNKQLNKYLHEKKSRRERTKFSGNIWGYIAVIFILLLAVIIYMIISRLPH